MSASWPPAAAPAAAAAAGSPAALAMLFPSLPPGFAPSLPPGFAVDAAASAELIGPFQSGIQSSGCANVSQLVLDAITARKRMREAVAAPRPPIIPRSEEEMVFLRRLKMPPGPGPLAHARAHRNSRAQPICRPLTVVGRGSAFRGLASSRRVEHGFGDGCRCSTGKREARRSEGNLHTMPPVLPWVLTLHVVCASLRCCVWSVVESESQLQQCSFIMDWFLVTGHCVRINAVVREDSSGAARCCMRLTAQRTAVRMLSVLHASPDFAFFAFGEYPFRFRCAECDEGFAPTPDTLLNPMASSRHGYTWAFLHTRSCPGGKIVDCPYCRNRTFAGRSGLQTHMRSCKSKPKPHTHTNDQPPSDPSAHAGHGGASDGPVPKVLDSSNEKGAARSRGEEESGANNPSKNKRRRKQKDSTIARPATLPQLPSLTSSIFQPSEDMYSTGTSSELFMWNSSGWQPEAEPQGSDVNLPCLAADAFSPFCLPADHDFLN